MNPLDAQLARLTAGERIALARRLRARLPALAGSVRLHAVLESSGGPPSPDLTEAVRASLRAHLPPPLQPSLEWTERLPRLPNGKVDRRAPGAGPARVSDAASDTPSARWSNHREARFAAIWTRVLGRSDFGPADDFFALGGDSLAAMRVVTLARQAGLACSIAAFFARPTVVGLAQGASESPPPPAVATPTASARTDAVLTLEPSLPTDPRLIRYGGVRPSCLVVVHGIEGYGLLAGRLAGRLPESVEIIAIEAPEEPAPSIEETARRYLAAVEPLVGSRPFGFAGYCFGGAVAFEMARQCAATRHPPRRVWIVDSAVPRLNRPRVRRVLAVEGWGGLFRRLRQRMGHVFPLAAARSRRAEGPNGSVDPAYFGSIAEDRWAITRHHIRAIVAYRPPPGDFPVTLIHTPPSSPLIGADLGWRSRVRGELRVHALACSHADLIKEPAVLEVARRIAAEFPGATPA
jgi:thioesterase domain-containing protein